MQEIYFEVVASILSIIVWITFVIYVEANYEFPLPLFILLNLSFYVP